MFGLLDSDLKVIISVISEYSEVNKAIIFGSRAKGNFKLGSDVDIALEGDSISFAILRSINSKLNEDTCLPYKFDVLDAKLISNIELIEHIQRIGVVIYSK